MKIKKELIKRCIGSDVILVPVGKTVLESNGLFVMNELAAFIWDTLPSVESEEDILKAVLAEYEVSEEEASADIAEFLATLQKMNII